MSILRENCLLEKQTVVKENNKVIVRGIFSRANTPNKNERVYTRDLWKGLLENKDVKEMLNSRGMLGELDHPDVTDTSLKNVSHIVTKLELLPNDEVHGEAEILNTPNGQILQKLLEAGVKVGISSRGYVPDNSKAKTTPKGHYEVPESFVLKTFDFVLDPSTPGAFPSVVSESTKQGILELVESSGSAISGQVRAICESLNTSLNTTSKKGEENMNEEVQKRDQTILALESSYRAAVAEKDRLINENATLKVSASRLEEVSEELKVAESRILSLGKQFSTAMNQELQAAEQVIVDLQSQSEEKDEVSVEVIEALRDVIEGLNDKVDTAVGVIEEFNARYAAAETLLGEKEDRIQELEAILNVRESTIIAYQQRDEMDSFITAKADLLGMSESEVRSKVQHCTTTQEAAEALLSVKSFVEKNRRTLPGSGNKSIKENAPVPQTDGKTKEQSKVARAIAQMK